MSISLVFSFGDEIVKMFLKTMRKKEKQTQQNFFTSKKQT